MKFNGLWLITLCIILILISIIGLNIPLRIALFINAILILINIVTQIRRIKNGRNK